MSKVQVPMSKECPKPNVQDDCESPFWDFELGHFLDIEIWTLGF